MSRFLAHAESEFGADIIIARLAEAGIHAASPSVNSESGGAIGKWNIYVEEADLERAREVLAEAESVDEDELARLAEEAGPPPRV